MSGLCGKKGVASEIIRPKKREKEKERERQSLNSRSMTIKKPEKKKR